jgi:drug/metabolite transporter (DMT)-like permease
MESAIKPVSIILILLSVGLALGGQIFLRRGMQDVKDKTGMGTTDLMKKPMTFLQQILTTWAVLFGLLLFVSSAVFWLIVLSDVPLGFAYPFVSLTYICVMLYDKFVENRNILALNWLGVVGIVIGIVLITWGQWTKVTP